MAYFLPTFGFNEERVRKIALFLLKHVDGGRFLPITPQIIHYGIS
jgi:hypothetical protein